MAGPVHYEVYLRKTPPSPWTLLMATEDRKIATDTAEDMLSDQRAVAVRVTKETLDPETMEFSSITVLTRGAPEAPKKRSVNADDRPACNTPADLYSPHARDLIGRVLEDWLMRNGVTAFELLHRPDLVERLEASGVEVQHAIQKVAIPESQSTGQPAHELVRHYLKLTEQAMERVVSAGRRRTFAIFADTSLADAAHRLKGAPDRAFVMGGVLANRLSGVRGPRARLERLMDMADGAPFDGAPRALVMVGIEQILIELLTPRTHLLEILGPALDQGAALMAIIRMVAPREIALLMAHDPRMGVLTPVIEGPAARLGEHLAQGDYPILAASLARMVVRELTGPKRLRPGDAQGEIDILRCLAMALTATAGRLLTLEEVQSSFLDRSRSLVTADFVAAYVASCQTVMAEAEALTRLCENVTGTINKRSAARWLVACVGSLRFESELRQSPVKAGQKLGILATLQRSVRASALADCDERAILDVIGAVGGTIEAEARLTTALARAPVPVAQKLAALLRLAAGETGPSGAVADRARAEALRLFRSPETRTLLSATPEHLGTLKPLMQAVGLAA